MRDVGSRPQATSHKGACLLLWERACARQLSQRASVGSHSQATRVENMKADGGALCHLTHESGLDNGNSEFPDEKHWTPRRCMLNAPRS